MSTATQEPAPTPESVLIELQDAVRLLQDAADNLHAVIEQRRQGS